MPALREALTVAGMRDVRTYVQSGNVVLSSDMSPDQLVRDCEELIAEHFGFDVPVIVRTRAELERVVELNPLRDVAVEPKRYQVSFCAGAPDRDAISRMASLAVGDERVVAVGREVYAWHPAGVARSKLWAGLAGTGLGVTGTARNWTTVTTLAAMARE